MMPPENPFGWEKLGSKFVICENSGLSCPGISSTIKAGRSVNSEFWITAAKSREVLLSSCGIFGGVGVGPVDDNPVSQALSGLVLRHRNSARTSLRRYGHLTLPQHRVRGAREVRCY